MTHSRFTSSSRPLEAPAPLERTPVAPLVWRHIALPVLGLAAVFVVATLVCAVLP